MKNPFYSLIFLSFCSFSFGQHPVYWVWYNPGIFEGSPSGLKFDTEGDLWMVTDSKLIEFDGINWTSFDFEEAGISIEYPFMHGFDFSSDQKVWCSTFNHVLEFDLNLHTWTLHTPGNEEFMHGKDIAVDQNNGVWWATENSLYEYNGSVWTEHIFTNYDPTKILGGLLHFIKIDEDNTKWVTTFGAYPPGGYVPAGVIKFSDTDTVFYTGESLGLPLAWVINLDFNADGDPVIVVTVNDEEDGNYVLTYNNGTWSAPEETLLNGYVHDLQVASDGKIYFGLPKSVGFGEVGSNIWEEIVPDPDTIIQIYSIEVSEKDELFVGGINNGPPYSMLGLAYLPVFKYRINGTLYSDQNFNGLSDSTDLKLKNRIVKTVDGERAAFSNKNGAYSLLLSAPGTWSIEALLPPYFSFGVPPEGIQEVTLTAQDSIADDIHFGFEPDTTAIDLSITLSPLTNANPGFNVWYVINYKNLVPNVTDAQIVCNFDSLLTYQNAVPAPTSINGNQFIFQTPPLNWLEEGSIRICFSLPPDGGLVGQILSHDCSILPLNGSDLNLLNNNYSLRHIITGPADPNNITVNPAGIGPLGKISRYTPSLEYTIHFQNVGTDTARNVIVSNPIDPDLDIYTLDIVGYSHEFSIDYNDQDRILRWVFEDIDLVDSLTNEVESNGFVKYTIAPAFQEVGTAMTNYADIYFDFNLPVQTNTVINLLVDTTNETILADTLCEGEYYLFAGDTLTEGGIYYDTLVSMEGTDSIIILSLVVNPAYDTIVEVGICEGQIFQWGGQVLFECGTYVANFPTSENCDSIVTLVLECVPFFSDTVEAAICEGETYYFQGEILIMAGIYVDTLTASGGCDSIVTLILTVNPNYWENLEAAICEGEPFEFGGEFLTEAGTYADTLQSITGCDSILILDLEVFPEYETQLEAEICQGAFFDFNGSILTETGIYGDSLVSINGCDSVVILTLTVHLSFTANFNAAICEGQSFEFNGEILTESGVYTDTLQTFTGCDSIQILDLEVLPEYETQLEAAICQGSAYDFNGTILTEGGIYSDTLAAITGCDSVLVLDLTVHPSFTETFNAAICEGQSFESNGEILTEPGVYTDTLQTFTGCDSILILDLIVLPEYETQLEAEICQGAAFDFNGALLTEAGTYGDSLVSINGCDSVIILTLTVHPSFTANFNAAICEGQSFEFNGEILTEAGTYTDSLQAITGCDSILILGLEVNPVFETPLEAEINAGESFEFSGESLTESGVYFDTLFTTEGCDSVLVLTLTVITNTSEAVFGETCDYSLTANPDFLLIQFSSAGSRTISIFDLNGRRLKSVSSKQQEISVLLEELANGVYVVSIQGEECFQSKARLIAKFR